MNETKYYYLDRAALLRGLAEEAQTPQLRKSCLKAAADYDDLAEKAEMEEFRPDRRDTNGFLRG